MERNENMAYTLGEQKRVEELYLSIENNKSHEYAAPTYKDRAAMMEMEQIAISHENRDLEDLSDTIPILWYLSECYDRMCRAGLSVKFHNLLIEYQMRRHNLQPFNADEIKRMETLLYDACKARNYYEYDDCADLITLTKDVLTQEKAESLVASAIEYRANFVKNDPVEKTQEYLAVIDEVERLIDENKKMDFCLETWSLKEHYLLERGIEWLSPATLNPNVHFD